MNVTGQDALVVAAVSLAAVLLLSGIGKLLDAGSSRSVVRTLRIPEALQPLAPLLPCAELCIGIALLIAPWPLRVVPAVLALSLAVSYLVAVARALGFDEPVECRCFGRLGSGVVTPGMVVRNAMIVVAAVLTALWAGPDSVLTWILDHGAAGWTWILAAAGAAVLAALVVRSRGTVDSQTHRAAGRLPHDDYQRTPIPYGLLHDLDQKPYPLSELAREHAVVLVFARLHCDPCLSATQQLSAFVDRTGVVHGHLVIPESEQHLVQALPAGVSVLVDPERSVSRTFGVQMPAAVLLGADGLLAGGPVQGPEEIADFFGDILDELAARDR